MALEKMMGSMPGINPTQAPGGLAKGPQGTGSAIDGADFRKALDQFQGTTPVAAKPTASVDSLKFSNHAVERMTSRGIRFEPEMMKKIEDAVAKAAAKGSKDALVLTGDSALIVSVKNKTVVTVMDQATMKNNVFTNIDSTVMV